jgi:hypothetical protein
MYVVGSVKLPRFKAEYLVLIFLILTEFLPPVAKPFQAYRLIFSEYRWEQLGEKQPLTKAIEAIKNIDPQGLQPVLIEYVPQLANWYLKNPIAMMPDPFAKSVLSSGNPLFGITTEPHFHIWYTDYQQNWACHPNCDFRIEGGDFGVGKSYDLHIPSKAKKLKFCIDLAIATNQWNNSPFMNLKSSALMPEGENKGQMILAHRCN